MDKMILKPTRRQLLQIAAGSLLGSGLQGCVTGELYTPEPKPQVKLDILWTRRQEWKGKEFVRCVLNVGDRFMMVRSHDTLGWVFPGGPIRTDLHGPPDEKAKDLRNAAADYAHSQAMVQVWSKMTSVIAYGYGIVENTPEILLTHWVSVGVPTSMLPTPHANLETILEARWVNPEDPSAEGYCLRQRLEEVTQAKEGRTVMINICRI